MTELVTDAIFKIIILSVPFLALGLIASLVIGFFQAVTQIQDSTIAFVPRLVLLLVLVAIGLPWFMGMIADYAGHLFKNITFVSG